MFHGIEKLPAGHVMTVDEDGSIRRTAYWDAIVAAPQRLYPDDYYAERSLDLLRESARIHMMSDVPVGAFLSGGLDSSSMVALMAEQSSRRVNTFSVGFEACERLQRTRLRAPGRQAFRHQPSRSDHRSQKGAGIPPELVHSQDEPIADWVCVPLYFVSKLARDSGVIVVQVGEGADELMCGYPRYLASLTVQRLWPWLSMVPSAAWQVGGALAARVRDVGWRPARKAERLMELLAYGDGRFWGGAIVFDPAAKGRLLDTAMWHNNGRFDSSRVLDDFQTRMEADQARRRRAGTDDLPGA